MERIENGEITAITSTLVLNELMFKILMAELSNYSQKLNIWVAKKLLKNEEIRAKVYESVEEYINYLKYLENLDIVEITPRISFLSIELGSKYGLLTSDAYHLACMKEHEIKSIATDDTDFKKVEWVEVIDVRKLLQ